MAHIFTGYLWHGLKAVLNREPTREELNKAIDAIQEYWGKNVFNVIAKDDK